MDCKRWPDFLIIGAAKSGTTSLYRHLIVHPDIFMPAVKEPRYFAFAATPPDPADPILRDSVTSERMYLELFSAATPGQSLGEASPIYLADAAACGTIRARLPKVKLIVILRDPAERAFSHFLMSQRQGYEPQTSFIKAISEPVLTLGDWLRVRPYIPYSQYGAALERYLSCFPREQLLVLMTKDLARDQEATLRRLTDFIGVSPVTSADVLRKDNVGHTVRNPLVPRLLNSPLALATAQAIPVTMRRKVKALLQYANNTERQMTPQDRATVLHHLGDDIRKAEELLNVNLSEWRA